MANWADIVGRVTQPEDRSAAPSRAASGHDGGAQVELTRLRRSIDNIDSALIHLLAERFKCTQQVGALKSAYGLPPADPGREKVQIARLRRLAEEAQLDPVFAEKFLAFVIAEVIHHHELIASAGQAVE